MSDEGMSEFPALIFMFKFFYALFYYDLGCGGQMVPKSLQFYMYDVPLSELWETETEG